ncbi:hypothetical protein D9M68_935000 [compost metagenome]
MHHTVALAELDEEPVVAAQQLIEPAGQQLGRLGFADDLLHQPDLVLQVVPVQFDEVPARRERHQHRQPHQDRGRHQRVESGQARGQWQPPEHQFEASGTSST